MFVRRGRKVYLRDAPGGPEPITGEPTPPAVPPVPPTPPVVPPTPPVVKPFDPTTLSPEAQAYLRDQEQAIATREGGKAREVARENARKEALADLAKAWGAENKPVDPAAAAAELVAARAEARSLRIDQAIDRAARTAKADGDIVGALLAKNGKLAELDPAAADFATRVEALVTEIVKGNPRVLLDVGTPAGGQAPVNNGFSGQPTDGQRPGLLAAINAHYQR